MEHRNTKFLILMCFFIICTSLCFSNERIDSMCGTWTFVNRNKTFYESLALEKISEVEYFVLYTRSVDHSLDFSEKGTVISDNLILIKNDVGDFYVYLDYCKNSVYLLWNHIFPDVKYYDVELKRVSEIFDDQLKQQRQIELEKHLRDSVIDSFR